MMSKTNYDKKNAPFLNIDADLNALIKNENTNLTNDTKDE